MLRVQRLVPRVPPRAARRRCCEAIGAKRFVDWSFNHYLDIAHPSFALEGPHGTRDLVGGGGTARASAVAAA